MTRPSWPGAVQLLSVPEYAPPPGRGSDVREARAGRFARQRAVVERTIVGPAAAFAVLLVSVQLFSVPSSRPRRRPTIARGRGGGWLRAELPVRVQLLSVL